MDDDDFYYDDDDYYDDDGYCYCPECYAYMSGYRAGYSDALDELE